MANHNPQNPGDKASLRFRFAPSPNGWLHLGHAYSALFTQRAARAAGAELLLRIEDIDQTRSRPEFSNGIREDMDWLGIHFAPDVRIQSNHFADYEKALDQLADLGILYTCAATRKQIDAEISTRKNPDNWPRDPDGSPLYPGIWRDRSDDNYARLMKSGVPVAIRLDMTKAVALLKTRNAFPLTFEEQGIGPDGQTGQVQLDPQIWGDVVLARKDTPTSYHLSVVVDDADQGITHITRGQDLFFATAIHRLLQILLDFPEPVYCHHRLIRAGDDRKLSKSAMDASLKSLRQSGTSADEVRHMLGFDRPD
ncbi:MAG: tRNA glutamyl-Q(34) synthetase GluQRS [Rhizobiales bacterium]|nr:tRNA glutamyl-Q(34) synthetase GluQRS [Hyphomicrobiales bacterium]